MYARARLFAAVVLVVASVAASASPLLAPSGLLPTMQAAIQAGPSQPDMWVRVAGGLWLGSNIYNATGMGQTATSTLRRLQTGMYPLSVQNDGTLTWRFLVKGTGSSADLTVRYFDQPAGGVNITALVTGGGWLAPPLAPGASKLFRVEITPTAIAPPEVSRTVAISAAAPSPPSTDVVNAVVRIAPLFRPDGLIRNHSVAAFVGNNIYNITAIGQTVGQTVATGVRADYHVRIENDGMLGDRFLVTGTAPSPGVSVTYQTAAGFDVSFAVTHGGWLSPVIMPGAATEIRPRVTMTSTVLSGVRKDVRVTIRSVGDAAKLDVVKAQTTKL